jgi:hypothetical protein
MPNLFTSFCSRRWAGAALLAAAAGSAQAGVSVGVDIGLPGYYGPAGAVSVRYGHRGWYRGGWGWGVVVGAPWVVVPVTPAVTVVETQPAAPAAPARPDPVITPRNGQSPQQTEADRQDCNRWATTQPAAMADAAVFQRAVEACMDARGYTVK